MSVEPCQAWRVDGIRGDEEVFLEEQTGQEIYLKVYTVYRGNVPDEPLWLRSKRRWRFLQ